MSGAARALGSSRVRFALSAGGYACATIVLYVLVTSGRLPFPGGDVDYYVFAGDAFRAGTNPYVLLTPTNSFIYAPPWAALFGLVSWAGPAVVHSLIIVADLIALRYLGGSWLAVGWLCWFPLVPWEIGSGQLNLLVAAAIVAGVRRTVWPAAIMGLAKISPWLAVSWRDWGRLLLAVGLACCLSLPRLDLWPLWIERLFQAAEVPPGIPVPIPLGVRLVAGLILILYGRPWSRALGAVIATPAFYWASFVMLVAPIALLLPGNRLVPAGAPAPHDREGPQPAGSGA